jgi:hypothetical protein
MRKAMSERLSRAVVALLLAGGTGTALAQSPSPSPPSGEAANVGWKQPPAAAPSLPSGPVGARPDTATRVDPAKASRYLALRALSTADGEARIQTGDGERTLRPGDLLGGDVVRAVDTGILVLDRKAAPGAAGGDARVVIRFDGQGRPTVRIYHAEDPTRVEARPTR